MLMAYMLTAYSAYGGLDQIPNLHTASPVSSHTRFHQLVHSVATMPEITRLPDQTTIPLQSTSALTLVQQEKRLRTTTNNTTTLLVLTLVIPKISCFLDGWQLYHLVSKMGVFVELE